MAKDKAGDVSILIFLSPMSDCAAQIAGKASSHPVSVPLFSGSITRAKFGVLAACGLCRLFTTFPSFSRGPLLGVKEKYSGFEAGALKRRLIPVLGRVSATLWPNQRLS